MPSHPPKMMALKPNTIAATTIVIICADLATAAIKSDSGMPITNSNTPQNVSHSLIAHLLNNLLDGDVLDKRCLPTPWTLRMDARIVHVVRRREL